MQPLRESTTDNTCHTDRWYAERAVCLLKRLGWRPNAPSAYTVRLVHPEGREHFASRGVVFIDGPSTEPGHCEHLCVLFPGQGMRLHCHEKRAEVFKVIGGRICATREHGREAAVPVDGYLESRAGEEHGVATDAAGGACVGVCHASHTNDVRWREGRDGSGRWPLAKEPEQRVTVLKMPPNFDELDVDVSAVFGLPPASPPGDVAAHICDAFRRAQELNRELK